MRPDGPRPTIIGPDSGPEKPFPLRMGGKVVSGFGRGSKEVRLSLLFCSVVPLLEGLFTVIATYQLRSASMVERRR